MRDIGFDHVENIRGLLKAGKSGRIIELPGSIAVERNFGQLVFRRRMLRLPAMNTNCPFRAGYISRKSIPFSMLTYVRRKPLNLSREGPLSMVNLWDRVLRSGTGKNGDFYNPNGLGSAKLKELFQRERIPGGRDVSGRFLSPNHLLSG